MKQALVTIFLVAGLATMFGAGLAYNSTRRFLDSSHKTQGVVVSVEQEEDSDGGKTFRSVVRFRDLAGKPRTFKSQFASNPAVHTAGDTVTVFYVPSNPSQAKVDGFWSLWLFPILAIVIGTVFLSLAIAVHMRKPQPAIMPSEM